MVLSACSPYFQALFINHPEKHPIVILKDITFADMKSLLDFMYRGEVSVDQDRLTAFLRVAESLRIKGLTEVNDDKPEKTEPIQNQQTTAQTQPQPPQLHRIQQPYTQQQQQQKAQGMLLTNPLLGSALTQPKRKRGRPRKLSGSSNGNDFDDYESSDNIIQVSNIPFLYTDHKLLLNPFKIQICLNGMFCGCVVRSLLLCCNAHYSNLNESDLHLLFISK